VLIDNSQGLEKMKIFKDVIFLPLFKLMQAMLANE
jgi:hypothetical protein